MRLPPLNALRAFEAAARHLSLRKAAAELHVTPAAISHQIKTLERALGMPVFKRLPQRVELTPAGEALLPRLTAALENVAEAVASVQRLHRAGRVTVAAPPALAAKWLAPRLHRFTALFPDIDLNITADGSLIDSVREDSGEAGNLLEDADLAIRSGHGDYEGYVAHRLFSAYAIPMCSPRLLGGPHPLREPSDLRHHTLLHHETGLDQTDADRPNWSAWLKAAGVRGVNERRGPTFNQVAMAMEAAADGLGVVLGIPVVAAADLESGRLVMPFALSLPIEASYYLVHTEKSAREPSVAALRDWLRAEAASERWAEPPPVSIPAGLTD
ncbi:MAG: LysR family transcriptional regulator [Panacagrimonas sp.]|jgi:LysR family glycine cleavage system transcriptional activator|nr:transcriptional regulator GcvA [Panacagrimonas sp.]MCC2656793.1 LysR family transcriptional regulator [Panacagrimonas sp.]